jgi:hypothetical protein
MAGIFELGDDDDGIAAADEQGDEALVCICGLHVCADGDKNDNKLAHGDAVAVAGLPLPRAIDGSVDAAANSGTAVIRDAFVPVCAPFVYEPFVLTLF